MLCAGVEGGNAIQRLTGEEPDGALVGARDTIEHNVELACRCSDNSDFFARDPELVFEATLVLTRESYKVGGSAKVEKRLEFKGKFLGFRFGKIAIEVFCRASVVLGFSGAKKAEDGSVGRGASEGIGGRRRGRWSWNGCGRTRVGSLGGSARNLNSRGRGLCLDRVLGAGAGERGNEQAHQNAQGSRA